MGEHQIEIPALRRGVFLDRDGVLNEALVRDGKPYPPGSLEEFRIIPGVQEACKRLAAAGFVLVVATNQPDVGRGTMPQSLVEKIHQMLQREIPELSRIEVCYDPGGAISSPRRKPSPGMLRDAARELGLDLTRSYMIGDRWRDIDCGASAGCKTIWIDYGYSEPLRAQPDKTCRSLDEAAEWILGQS